MYEPQHWDLDDPETDCWDGNYPGQEDEDGDDTPDNDTPYMTEDDSYDEICSLNDDCDF